ncbi:MAG: transporter [Betaproteobacteria bacterium]|nr:transporter [Betaproteobacteria bacterium]
MRFRKAAVGLAAALSCAAGSQAALAAGPENLFGLGPGKLSLGAGIDYSSGDYGTSTTTDITSVMLTGRYDTDMWAFKLTLPYLYISGGTGVIPGIGEVTNRNPRGRGRNAATGTTAAEGSASGWGDLVAAATYHTYYDQSSAFGVDLTGKIKLGTANADKGLGTGANDYGFNVDAFKGYGRYTLFGGVGYSVLGSSQYIQLNNVLNANVGGSYKLDEANSLGLVYFAQERASSSGHPQSDLTAFYTHKIDRTWKAQAYVLKGFADGSPDWAVGANAAYAF